MPSEAGMEKLHADLLSLLKEFHGLCVNNNIKYSLHGGSLLGAIREKGFIPWDDDIDVTMTRFEYEKLKKVMLEENNTLYWNESAGLGPMICLKNKDVWIDIFIYDYISENKLAQKIKFLMLVFFLGWTKTKKSIKVTKIGKFKGWKFYAVYMLYLLGKPISKARKCKMRDYFTENFLCGSKKLMVRVNDRYVGLKMFVSKEAILSYREVQFEDIKVMIHSGYDEILRRSYGDDYMLPIRIEESHKKAHDIARKGISV